MSTVWDGRVADLKKQGVPVERQLNGMRRQFQGYAIAKGAANADDAYQLMDFSLRAEIQANLAKAFPSNPSSPLAYAKLTEDERNALVRCAEVLRQGLRRGHRLVAEERIGRHQALAGVGSWLNSVSPHRPSKVAGVKPATATGKSLSVVALRKTYGDVVAVDEASMEIAAGEFVTFLGSSGSGKTTTLMMIAGFCEPDSGTITVGGP